MRQRDLMFAAGAIAKLVRVVFNESPANSLGNKIIFFFNNGQKNDKYFI